MSDKYVLLIDGDNVNSSYFIPFAEYIEANLGEISAVHLFGKLESTYLKDWKEVCPLYKGKQVNYNIGDSRKNSTDIRMIHIAWKLFYGDNVRHFVIMSSDSDMGAVVTELSKEASVVIGYSRHKVSEKYLQTLKSRSIPFVDLDSLRGELAGDALSQAINCTARSYLEFKLDKERFSYDVLLSWIVERYPELGSLTQNDLLHHLNEFQVSFSKEGAVVTPK